MHRQTSPRTESSLGANDLAFRQPGKPGYKLGFHGRHAGHADFLRELGFMPAHAWYARHADFGPAFAGKAWVYPKSVTIYPNFPEKPVGK